MGIKWSRENDAPIAREISRHYPFSKMTYSSIEKYLALNESPTEDYRSIQASESWYRSKRMFGCGAANFCLHGSIQVSEELVMKGHWDGCRITLRNETYKFKSRGTIKGTFNGGIFFFWQNFQWRYICTDNYQKKETEPRGVGVKPRGQRVVPRAGSGRICTGDRTVLFLFFILI